MNQHDLALHVLRHLVIAQVRGEAASLDRVTRAVGARRADVRGAVSALHRDGFVDALRMRPTLAGLALGRALARVRLPALRPRLAATSRAA